MLRRRLQQLSSVVNVISFAFLLALLLAHILLRRYQPNVSHGKENSDFFFEGEQEGDDQHGHHPPFVIDWRVLLGTLLAFLVSCAVDVGGLAGGGLLVPVFYQVVGFGLKASTGLSQAAIAGASAAALAANLFRAQTPLHSQHSSYRSSGPHASTGTAWLQDQDQGHQHTSTRQQQQQRPQQQPLVDLDLVLLLTPGLLLGVAVGAVLNDLLPEWFICAALVGVLWLSCHKTAVRGLLTWHAEAQAEASLAAAAAISGGPQPRLKPIHTGGATRSTDGHSTCSPGSMPGAPAAAAAAADSAGAAGVGLCCSSPQPSSASKVFAWDADAAAAVHNKQQQQQAAAAAAQEKEEACRGSSPPAACGSEGSTPQPGTPQPPSSGGALLQTVSAAAPAPAGGSDAVMQQQGEQQQRAEAAGACSPVHDAAAVSLSTQPAAAAVTPGVASPSAAATAAGDSDSSSSSPSCTQLHKQPSLPIYQCETTPLPPRGLAYSAAGPHRGLARKGLYPGWFSMPDAAEPLLDDAAAAAAGPTVEWRPCSRSSSVGTGVGYVIADDRLPAWRNQQQQQQQQHQHPSSIGGGGRAAAAAAAAAAVAAEHLQQLWLWLPPVQLEQVPWMKLLSLVAMWLGFMGLTALSGLLPLCSWSYVTYLLLFMGVTGCVTAVLVQVLLVEPLPGAQQVSAFSRKLQQFVQAHYVHRHSQQRGDVEAQQQQGLRQPLLQGSCGQPCQQGGAGSPLRHPEQQQGAAAAAAAAVGLFPSRGTVSGAADANAAAGAGAWAVPRRAFGSARTWLHVLTGFGRASSSAAQPDDTAGVPAATAAAADAGDAPPHDGAAPSLQQQQDEQQQQKLSLFAQTRLQQQQQRQGPWGPTYQPALPQPPPPVLPPIGPVAAATDSYFFPTAAGPGGAVVGQPRQQQCQPQPPAAAAPGSMGYGQGLHSQQVPLPPRRALGPPAAATAAGCTNTSSSCGSAQGLGALWAGFRRVLGVGQQAPEPQLQQQPVVDPFDGNEQPWRDEQPFPVAAASPVAGPAVSLAAAAAAAAGGSSALVTIAAAAAVVSIAAGVLTAVTGVASSALLLPILLDFRVHTQVAMASTVVLVFLSSTAATLSFILQGRLIGTYAGLFCLVGLCGGCVGVSVVGALLRLARRPSVVVLLLSGALAVAGTSCSVAGVVGFVDAWEQGRLGVRALCRQ